MRQSAVLECAILRSSGLGADCICRDIKTSDMQWKWKAFINDLTSVDWFVVAIQQLYRLYLARAICDGGLRGEERSLVKINFEDSGLMDSDVVLLGE